MKFPLVSVIIVNFNGREYLEDCLSSLKRTSYENKEIILVDNGSSDDSIEIAKRILPSIKIIENKTNLFFARANNQGYEIAKGKYIFLLNNDTKVDKSIFEEQIKYLEGHPECGATQPRVLRMDDPTKLDSIGSFFTRTGFLYHYAFGKADAPTLRKKIELFSAKGCSLMLRSELIKKIGLFDEDFVAYFEETDLCWRIWLSGHTVNYIPSNFILHKGWGTASRVNFSRILFHSYKNRIATLVKNLDSKNLLLILPLHLLLCVAAPLGYVFVGKPKNGLAVLSALGWVFLNSTELVKKRKANQGIRKIKDEEFLPKLTRQVSPKYFLYLFTGLEKYEK